MSCSHAAKKLKEGNACWPSHCLENGAKPCFYFQGLNLESWFIKWKQLYVLILLWVFFFMHYASLWVCFSGKESILLYNLSASEMGTWIYNSLAFCSSQTDCSPLPSLPISLINLPGARDINDEGMSCWTKESGHPQIKGTDSSYSWLFFLLCWGKEAEKQFRKQTS